VPNKARHACERRRDGEAAVSTRTPLEGISNILTMKSLYRLKDKRKGNARFLTARS
jgi:hypothetical protein